VPFGVIFGAGLKPGYFYFVAIAKTLWVLIAQVIFSGPTLRVVGRGLTNLGGFFLKK